MESRNIKEISNKAYQNVIGILLCLLSAVLCINAGYVAKGLSFSFSYALGMGSYLFYAFLFIEGCFLLFTHRPLSIKSSIYFWFGIILALGVFGLITYISVDQTSAYLSFVNGDGQVGIIEKISGVFGNISYGDGVANYFEKDPVVVFFGDNEFGCGLIGYALLALGNSVFSSTTGGLVISIVLMAVGFIGIVLPIVLKIVKSKKNVAPEVPANKKETNSHKRIKNINVVKGAKNIDPKTYHSEVSGAGKNVKNYSETVAPKTIAPVPAVNSGFGNSYLNGQNEEVAPEIESIDALKEAVFDVEGISIPSASKAEPVIANIEPIQELPKEEPIFAPAQNEIFAEEKTIEPVFDSPVVEEVIASKVETPVVQPQPQFTQPSPTPVQPTVTQSAPVNEEPKQEVPKKKERVKFTVMSSDMLKQYDTTSTAELNEQVAAERKEIINNTFKDFNIGAEVVDYTIGPSVTRFNVRYNSNVSSRAVNNIVQDISIRLNGVDARFESVVEGQSTSGLEISNKEITMVPFKDVYEALPDVKKHPLGVAFGKNIKGQVICSDFNEFPHILVSGTTGSGKSVFVNSIICSLIMRNSPDDLKLVLVDPKKVEMSRYADMPHLLTPIITEASKVKVCLDKLVDEMEERYSLFSKNNATNIKEYNEDCEFNGNERMPYIVAILDEYADLVDECKEISLPVVSLSQKARACGIHLMVATQRPSTNVVTGVIKANMPTHVALMTANYVDSITIIGEAGAEKLLGKGDMLVQSPLVSRVGVCRLQSCYIDRREIVAIVSDLKSKYPTVYDPNFLDLEEKKTSDFNPSEGGPEEVPGGGNDEESKYRSIKEWVMAQEYMSMSRIQRECAVGFNRAGRFFQRLQKEGVVGYETEGNKGCKVLIQDKFGSEFDDSAIATSEDNSYIK